MKNGLPYDGEFIFTPMDTSKIKKTNGNLIGIAGGTTQIKVQLKDYPQISQLLDVEIIDDVNSFSAYIDGPDVLRLDREATYTLIGTDTLTSDVTFVLDNDLAQIKSTANNNCIIHANDKNNLGSIILTATYGGVDYIKTIQIIPLW